MHSRLLAVLLLCLAAVPASAQAPSLAWLEGRWSGAGTMSGAASQAVLEVAPVLGGRFLELRYRANGFEGLALYRPAEGGRWQAHWFDNRGISFPIDARVESKLLISDWGSAETERGRTEYRLVDGDRLEVTDSVPAPDGGGWRVFARHSLTRTR